MSSDGPQGIARAPRAVTQHIMGLHPPLAAAQYVHIAHRARHGQWAGGDSGPDSSVPTGPWAVGDRANRPIRAQRPLRSGRCSFYRSSMEIWPSAVVPMRLLFFLFFVGRTKSGRKPDSCRGITWAFATSLSSGIRLSTMIT